METLSQEDIKERLEHRDALLNIRSVLSTKEGRGFFKYLFNQFQVTQLPAIGLEGNELMECLGFLRAGNSIFKLASEANPVAAATLLAEIEKERYAQIYQDANIGTT
jgi:hypothetical protein